MINKILTYNQLYPCNACICIIFYKIFISFCQTDFATNFISLWCYILIFFTMQGRKFQSMICFYIFFPKNWLIEYLRGVAKLLLSSRQLISFICFGDQYQYYFLSDLKGKKYIPLIKENAKSTVFIINIYLVSSNNFKHLPSKQPVNKNFN